MRILCARSYHISSVFALRVDRGTRFKYATRGREFFQKRRKKPPFSKISGFVWTRPISYSEVSRRKAVMLKRTPGNRSVQREYETWINLLRRFSITLFSAARAERTYKSMRKKTHA